MSTSICDSIIKYCDNYTIVKNSQIQHWQELPEKASLCENSNMYLMLRRCTHVFETFFQVFNIVLDVSESFHKIEASLVVLL